MKIIAAFLAGVIVGIILWEKIDAKTIFKGTVRIKQRGKGNHQDNLIKPEITPETRQEKRISKRNERKKRRSLKKLEKQTQ